MKFTASKLLALAACIVFVLGLFGVAFLNPVLLGLALLAAAFVV